MALKAPVATGGAFFAPADHTSDLILVVEGKALLKDQTFTDFTTKARSTRDELVADIHCFRNSADIAAGEPSEVLVGCKVTHGVLVGDIVANGWMDGGAGLAVVRRPGKFFAWRYEFGAEEQQVATAYYERLEAAREAAAGDMPDF